MQGLAVSSWCCNPFFTAVRRVYMLQHHQGFSLTFSWSNATCCLINHTNGSPPAFKADVHSTLLLQDAFPSAWGSFIWLQPPPWNAPICCGRGSPKIPAPSRACTLRSSTSMGCTTPGPSVLQVLGCVPVQLPVPAFVHCCCVGDTCMRFLHVAEYMS